MGQGAPEVGDIPGGSERPTTIDLSSMGSNINEYAPTAGVKDLRAAVADLYNKDYRVGKASQYTWENVCIVPGGRAGLTRVASVIGEVYVSYQVPEYTAYVLPPPKISNLPLIFASYCSYSEMLSSFRKLVPIPSTLSEEDAYHLNVDKLKKDIHEMGLSVVVASNPRNPTGQVIKGEELTKLCQLGKDGTTLILDEFYSWYQYEMGEGETVSAVRFLLLSLAFIKLILENFPPASSVLQLLCSKQATEIDDVNKDPIVLINGLTKCWRLPGWRGESIAPS